MANFNQTSYLEGDIRNMFTVPFARWKGFSAMILESLLEEARSPGCTKFRCTPRKTVKS